MARQTNPKLLADFFNKIGQQRRFRDVRVMSDLPQTADVRLVARHGSDGSMLSKKA